MAGMENLLPAYGEQPSEKLIIGSDPADPLLKEKSVQWAIEHLRDSWRRRGVSAEVRSSLDNLVPSGICIVVAGPASLMAREILERARVSIPTDAEALGILRGKVRGRPVLLATGADARGLVHAILELADRAQFAASPTVALKRVENCIQRPANKIRSIARLFASEIEDKSWFNDRAFWPRYLTELATQRFNRFSLTLGLGYDFPTDIRDAYLHFSYPFLVSVPGYSVKPVLLPVEERERNLAMLQFISEETTRRGLHFQLGLWTHAWKWVNSPKANYVIEGLSAETHAPYCRDALELLLRECPAIGGVTFRVHGESGIAEGSYEFWKTVFEGVAHCSRQVEIDLHAKGIDDRMIELAQATGMPVNVSPKFWAEHMGLGYMQGAIRPLEMPPRDTADAGFFAKSSGSRRFLRYGYGDLLKENRTYGVLHRIWPGTQRLLLWGSPELAADYGSASSFCGSVGVECCEPLSFKGRKGSGLPGGRDAYADVSLRPAGADFEKYLFSYRVWGRHIYDPRCAPDEWRRYLHRELGHAAPSVGAALEASSRILPLITTAHCPSAANNNYWPEMYTNMAIVDAKRPHPYDDTLNPKRFGAVSSLDPEFFSRVDDFAEELLRGEPGARYSPAWVAAELQLLVTKARTALNDARKKVGVAQSPEFRRLSFDVAIQNGLGEFFAGKFQAAILFALYEQTQSIAALEQAVTAYHEAHDAWAKMAQDAKAVYRSDVTFGPGSFQRGHWLDRLPAIEADISDMERLLQNAKEHPTSQPKVASAEMGRLINSILKVRLEPRLKVSPDFHVPPRSFRPGEPLLIEALAARGTGIPRLNSLRLRFRRVNQAEIWQVQEMILEGPKFQATVPASYTDSAYPLQYHFECHTRLGPSWFFPGVNPGSRRQPYFVLRQG
jgi:hypothetical protein